MLSYFGTDRYNKHGISFHPIHIGTHTSFGQRCICLSGVYLDSYVTVGAETLLPHDFYVNEGGSAFGVPPVLFTSTALCRDILKESQHTAAKLLHDVDGKQKDKISLKKNSRKLSETITDSRSLMEMDQLKTTRIR